MKEIWKDIKGYERLYEISNKGNVKSLNKKIQRSNDRIQTFKERKLKPGLSKNGYLTVQLFKNKKGKTKYIHKLVAEAFIPNLDNYPIINHKDENKQNNYVDNLEWCTYSYNNSYNDKMKNLRKKVLQYNKNNKFIKKWDGLINIQKELGINRNNITSVCKGKRKHAGGYIWKYEEFNE